MAAGLMPAELAGRMGMADGSVAMAAGFLADGGDLPAAVVDQVDVNVLVASDDKPVQL